ncbi:MAG: hypothetical protein WC730_02025 [Patescibacteria group bacterium]|jgi:phosphoesterase RecJ-like protein
MSLQLHEQLLSALERAKRPLIVLPKTANPDDFVSGFALAHLLEKLQKPIEMATIGGRAPKTLDFLSSKISVRGDLPNIRKLLIRLTAKETKIDELSYDIVDGEIHIHLTPKTGAWQEKDVIVNADGYRYDLILTVGARDLSQLGDLYKKYSDFFFETPIVNFDHTVENEQFGQLNIVDVNAVSISEIIFDLLRQLDPSLIDQEIATMLLTGMIYKTKSFKSPNVTPRTLKVASDLMSFGARRDEIVASLYRTRTVETLRLWGRALARLKSDKDHELVWTVLNQADFMNAGADETALADVINELIITSPQAKIAAIFYENKEHHVHVILHAERPHDALFLGAPFSASGTREEARLEIRDTSLMQAEKKVIGHVRSQLNHL